MIRQQVSIRCKPQESGSVRSHKVRSVTQSVYSSSKLGHVENDLATVNVALEITQLTAVNGRSYWTISFAQMSEE